MEKISGKEELLIFDVRKASEFEKKSIDIEEDQIFNYSSRKILKEMPEEVKEKISGQEIVVVCYKGNISQKVAAKLDSELENRVVSLENGMEGWKKFR
ncbi:MAG: rhodanese-like domain-containing protein [Candidatus Nanohalobium sp.]